MRQLSGGTVSRDCQRARAGGCESSIGLDQRGGFWVPMLLSVIHSKRAGTWSVLNIIEISGAVKFGPDHNFSFSPLGVTVEIVACPRLAQLTAKNESPLIESDRVFAGQKNEKDEFSYHCRTELPKRLPGKTAAPSNSVLSNSNYCSSNLTSEPSSAYRWRSCWSGFCGRFRVTWSWLRGWRG